MSETKRKFKEVPVKQGETPGTRAAAVRVNERQHRFCYEYVVDGNGTNAAVRAGYDEKGAAGTAHRLLRMEKIQTLISSLRSESRHRTRLTADRIDRELAHIAFQPLTDDELAGNPSCARNKTRALELLAKRLGLFEDTLHVNHTDSKPQAVPVGSLPLSLEKKREILQAIRESRHEIAGTVENSDDD